MSVKKKDLVHNVGDVVVVDYTPEMERRTLLSFKQEIRHKRLAIIVNLIAKPIYKQFSNDFDNLYRYEVIVGKEKIEIDQSCLVSI